MTVDEIICVYLRLSASICGCKLIVDRLPITNYQLPITNYPLPITK
ncbi:MAG: hypothetical protein HC849_34470 [Oscillatoriales cyanobacterium RU_3_3]|nr:hypothetical protein [Oscillatoriales cyanobacterium RU_3_3]